MFSLISIFYLALARVFVEWSEPVVSFFFLNVDIDDENEICDETRDSFAVSIFINIETI